MRTLQTIDYTEARQALDLIIEKTLNMQKAVSVAVADSHGDLICFARMDGAPVSSIRISMNKAWTAARERKPTKEVGDKVKHPESGHDIAYYGDPNYVGSRSRRMARWSEPLPSAVCRRAKMRRWQPWESN
jgi:glc operon protein GlcG